MLVMEQARQQGMRSPVAPTFESQLPLKIKYYLQNKRRDAHDTLKVLLDIMTGIIFIDDKWVVPQIVYPYEIDKSNPRVVVNLLEL